MNVSELSLSDQRQNFNLYSTQGQVELLSTHEFKRGATHKTQAFTRMSEPRCTGEQLQDRAATAMLWFFLVFCAFRSPHMMEGLGTVA